MNRFDDQITAVLEELARDPKDASNRKVVNDALLLAYRKGKVEARDSREDRVLEIAEGLEKTR